MAEALLAFLLMLGLVLAVVTLVGHGIWVLIAAIFRGNSANKLRENLTHKLSADGRRACPRCLTPTNSILGTCSVCGWPDPLLHSDAKAALSAVREQLNQYARLGIIDEAARDRFLAEIQKEEQLLVERALSAQRTAEANAAASATPTIVETPSELPATSEMPSTTGTVPSVPAPEPALASTAPVGERARRFAASRVEAALEPSASPSLEGRGIDEAKPAVPVSRLLAAFMEEKNIRWGELVGGLLIVGCSIALVISFWSEIAARPLLKFGLFNGVTAALFGAGLYTDRRWKIHTTSHGVLMIATLLVPLNFLAIAAFTQASPPTDLLSLAGETVSLLVFSLLVYLAGQILLPRAAPLLVAGVMIPSLMQLIVRRFAEPGMSLAGLYALAGAPIASYLATSVVVTRKSSRHTPCAVGDVELTPNGDAPSREVETSLPKASADGTRSVPATLDSSQGLALLVFLGLVSAATLLPLALVAYRSPPVDEVLQRLSPLVAVCGLPALLVGLVFWRRGNAWRGWGRAIASPQSTQFEAGPSIHPRHAALPIGPSQPSAGLQTAGIAVGVLGAMIMIAAVVLAWPEPALLLPTALTLAAVMFLVAIWFSIPSAHVPAGIALAAAWLIGFYLARGDIAWTLNDAQAMRQTLVSATSGHALLPLAGTFVALAGWLYRTKRTDHSFFFGLVAAATAAVSLGLVIWFGFARDGDPANATWTLAIYTLAALAAAVVLNRDDIAYVGSALLLATVVQAIVYRYALRSVTSEPWIVWITSILAHSTLAAVVGGALRLWQSGKSKNALRALIRSAQITSLVAAVWIVVTADRASAGGLCVNLAWLAGVWTLLAAVVGSRLFFDLSQIALVLSILCGVTAAVAGRPWYVAARHPWLDPWFLEAQGIALAAYCLLMRGVRGIFARLSHERQDDAADPSRRSWVEASRQLLTSPLPSTHDVVEVGLVLLVGCVAIYAALPGSAQELTPQPRGVVAPIEQFELAGIPHIHAADRGAWALVVAVIIALSVGLYQACASWRPIGLLLTASAVCPLLAARWGADMAVASALRWYSAGFFALASIGIWTMSSRLASDRWLESSRRPSSSGPLENNISDVLRQARDVLAALVVLIYVAMGAYVAQAAIYRAAMPRGYSWLWLYAGLWAVVVTVLALAIPRTIARKPNTFQVGTSRVATWLIGAREALLVVAFAPLAVLFTFAVARALDQYPIAGPLPASWFRRIGWDVSYSVPLAIIGLVFIGCAVRDRSSGFAFAAGLLFNAVATIVVLLRLARGGGALDATAWIVVTQFNAIVCGIVALVWLAVIEWHRRRQFVPSPGAMQTHAHQHRWPLLLLTQVTSAAALCAMFLVPAVFRLVVAPADFTWAIAADGVLGWSAVALAIAAALWIAWGRAINVNRRGFPVAAVVVLVALTAAHWDSGNWLAYHTLLAGACAAAWLLPIAGVVTNRAVVGPASPEPIAWSAPAARLFGLAAVLLAAWGYLGDPASPWWTLAALMAITARAVWIAWCERRPGFVWIAAVLFLPAASIFWLNWASRFSSIAGTGGTGQVFEFVWINALAAALLALVGVTVTRRWMALHSVDVIWQKGIVFHRFAAWAIVVTLLLTTVEGLFADLRNQPIAVSIPLVWAAWLAALVAALACWWDPGVRWPVACLYCIGLIGVGIYLDGLNFAAPMFHWALSLALAAYSLATSALWSAREKLTAVAARWRLPAASTSGHGWLVSANIVLGVCVLVLVSWIETTMPEFGRRMFAAYAIGAQVFAIGLLARGAVRTSLQYLALIWGVFFAVAFAWAWLPPDFQAPWLHRLVLTVVALVAMVIVYGFGILKFVRGENEWTRAAAQLVPPLSAIAAALIMLVLAVEVSTYLRSPAGSVPIVMPAVVAVGLSLLALAIAALVAALVPGRDPLGLSERGRTLYVYAAEGLAGLLFLHIRVTMPWLFHGWFIQFWPLVVMGIAFVGVGFAELFERRQTRVLAEPLHNTGVLLPLLPAIGFWVVRSRVDYSLLLLSIGVLYTAVSVLRQSFWYAVLAALAANGSLWYWLHTREGFGLLEHPQMWLIPPALCALAAGYINRERLTAQQSAALRYAAAMVIYASSTADVFIQGVANAPWLPAVLAGLSILGVLAGIVLRVRAFLYLGTTFLVVALMTVIWHAAIHERHTWILWVAGIITGTLIIVMFGVFEKRRDDVLRVVEQLKQWEA